VLLPYGYQGSRLKRLDTHQSKIQNHYQGSWSCRITYTPIQGSKSLQYAYPKQNISKSMTMLHTISNRCWFQGFNSYDSYSCFQLYCWLSISFLAYPVEHLQQVIFYFVPVIPHNVSKDFKRMISG